MKSDEKSFHKLIAQNKEDVVQTRTLAQEPPGDQILSKLEAEKGCPLLWSGMSEGVRPFQTQEMQPLRIAPTYETDGEPRCRSSRCSAHDY